MGKTLLKLLAILVLALLTTRWYIQHDLRKSLDEALLQMGPLVYVSYDRFDVGFDGVISLKRIKVNAAQGDQFSAFIQSVEVDLQSLPALIERYFSGRPPQQLSIEFKGVNANVSQLAASARADVDCLAPDKQPAPWMLGMDQDADLLLAYQYQPASLELTLDLSVLVRGSYEYSSQMRFGQVSPDLRQAGSLDMVRVSYDDIRAVDAWREYCARHHQMTPDALEQAHIAAMEKALNYQGLSMTEQARTVYQNYLDQPGRISARWILNLDFDNPEPPEVNRERFIDRLELEVAGEPVSPIFNRVEPLRDAPKLLQPKEAEQPAGPRQITFDEARDYIGRTISVVTGSKTTTGTIKSVGESELMVEVVKDGTNRFSITFYRSRIDDLLLEP